jgi:hypothetical protein
MREGHRFPPKNTNNQQGLAVRLHPMNDHTSGPLHSVSRRSVSRFDWLSQSQITDHKEHDTNVNVKFPQNKTFIKTTFKFGIEYLPTFY